MAKRLNYTIGVNADTSQLQAQLKSAINSLNTVGNKISLAPSIQEASRAALDLAQNLQRATNPTTGSLDLSKFNNELKKSGLTLEDYYIKLSKLGPAGQQAFMNVAQSITAAQVPLKRTSKLFDELWTTMKNTMRWQLTSSTLHVLVGTLQTAYGYAKDLNRSLNEIRIVTSKSAEDMTAFAEQANRAAKALSTTTVDYTDASLIYYQQGLNDKEVADRTDTTIKMANVAGTTAEEASQQLTAIWNNFYDGSKSLEYYADVMVKLGAATASSSDEISEGIEKFAAVANTVGLSYDYAASALATVTAQTRESASVVGTAFRTLFSRIQGLQQGETLDDGTTLNKYSTALAKVGVNIKDTDGQLKDMDVILSELGNKWETLAQDQKIALAETVAGVRQWTQLIALMDNWDFFEENLAIAQGSEGALEAQANIYAESWEAARKRIKAAGEDIYDSLINPDFFIGVDNVFTPILTGVADVIDGLGGMSGVLSGIVLLVNKIYGDKIAQSMRNMAASVGFLKNSDKQRAIALKEQAVELSKIAVYSNVEKKDFTQSDDIGFQKLEVQKQLIDLESQADKWAEKMTGRNAEILKGQIDRLKKESEILDVLKKETEEAARLKRQSENQLDGRLKGDSDWRQELGGSVIKNQKSGKIIGRTKVKSDYKSISKEIDSVVNDSSIKSSQDALKALENQLKPVAEQYVKLDAIQLEFSNNGKQVSQSMIDMVRNSGLLNEELKELSQEDADSFIINWLTEADGLEQSFNNCTEKIGAFQAAMLGLTDGSFTAENSIEGIVNAIIDLEAKGESAEQIIERLKKGSEALQKGYKKGAFATKDWADNLVDVGNMLSQVTMAINSANSIIDVFTTGLADGETYLDKFIKLLTNAGMLLPAIFGMFKKETAENIKLGLSYLFTGASAEASEVGIKNVGTALNAALPAIGLVIIALTAIIKIIDAIVVTSDEAREKIQETTDAYEEQKSQLESLNNELETTKDKIDELNGKDSLTLVEGEELKKLKQQEASLERQVKLQERLTKAAQKTQAEEIDKNFMKSTKKLAKGPNLDKDAPVFGNHVIDSDEDFEKYAAKDASKELYQTRLKIYNDWKEKNEKITEEWISENSEAIQQAESDYQSYIEAINAGIFDFNSDKVEEFQNRLKEIREKLYPDENEYFEVYIKPVLEEDSVEEVSGEIYQKLAEGASLEEVKGLISDPIKQALLNAGITVDEYLDRLQKQIDQTKKQLSEQGLNEEDFSSLSSEDWNILMSVDIEGIENVEELQAFLDKYKEEQKIEITVSGEESARNLISGIQSGDITYKNIGENEDYQNIIDQLDALKKEYPELEAYSIELSKTWEVGTQKFTEALEIVQDKLAHIKLNGLIEEANDASDKVAALLRIVNSGQWEEGPEKLADAMEELLDKNYAIDIEIHTQAEQEFDSISNAMQNIQDQASKIGEGFIIAASDIRSLNNTFPGIIDGMEEVGDGSYRLRQDVVENAIAAAQGEIAADTESTVSRLQAQATILRSKQKVYEQMAEAARVLAGNETDSAMTSADAQATLSAGLSDLKQLNSNASTNIELDNQEKTGDSSNDNASTTAKNWDSAYKSAAMSSANFANAAIANMKAVADNNPGGITEGNFKVNYQGSSGVSQEASVLQETQDALNHAENTSQGAWVQIAAQYENMAAAAAANANDIEGMIYQIGAAAGSTSHSLGNVGSSSGSGSSSGGSGGGGGSSNRTYDKEELKTLEDVEDRYHNINRQIERQSDLLDDLSNSTDRAWGTEALEGYAAEIAALEEQQENYNQKLLEAQDYLKSDGDLVKQYFADANIAANGEITNYEELLKENLNLYNAEVERYNQAVAGKELSEEEYNKYKAQLDEAQQLFEARQHALEQYEETLDVVRDTLDNIQDTARSLADKKLEEIKFKIQIVLDVKSMKDVVRDLRKSISEIFGDILTQNFAGYSNIESPLGLDAEAAQKEIELLGSYQEEWNSLKALYESTEDEADRKAIMEEMQSLQSNIAESAKAFIEWANSIEDIVPNAIDAAAERFSEFTNQLEHNTSVLDTIKELYALQGITYKTTEGFNRLQQNTQERMNASVATAQLQKTRADEAAKRLAEAQAKLDSLNGDESDPRYDTYKKARDAYLQEFNEAQEAYLSSAQKAMELAQEMYLQQIDKAAYEFGKAAANGTSLDLLQDKYDHYIEENERYFDKVNEAYQTSSWYNKLQADIDKTTNSAHKERLKVLQKEIDQRRENNKLSQYDLDILNAKYEVMQAQMALEDAQNAKNKIQLTRDSQGNWNYQYTADQDQIAEAQQNLLDAENEWYNTAKQQVTDVTGEITSTWQECQDKVKEIYSDMTLTDEERSAKAQEIYRYYSEKIKSLEEEKQIAIADMTEAGATNLLHNAAINGDAISGLISTDIQNVIDNYKGNINELLQLNGEQLEKIFGENTKFVDLFENTYATDLGKMTINAQNFEKALQEYLGKAEEDFKAYQGKVQETAKNTGTTLDELAKDTDVVSKSTEELRRQGQETTIALWDMVSAAQTLAFQQIELAASVWDSVNAYRSLTEEIARYARATSGLANGYDPNVDYEALIMDGLANGWLTYGSDQYRELFKQREAKIDDLGLTEDYYGTRGAAADERYRNATAVGQFTDEGTYREILDKLGVTDLGTTENGPVDKHDRPNEGIYAMNESPLVNGSGIKDKEELYNNKELYELYKKQNSDYLNELIAKSSLLAITPEILNSIEKALDSNAFASIALIGEKLDSLITNGVEVSNPIEQTVHIESVEFPNVTSRTEIEEAFVSLTNDAAQWARRRD